MYIIAAASKQEAKMQRTTQKRESKLFRESFQMVYSGTFSPQFNVIL